MDSFEEEDVLRSRERVIWTERSWIRRREEKGAYHQLIRELAIEDTPAFAGYFRMAKEKFNDLVGRISIHIQRQDTIMRAAIRKRLVYAYRCHQDVLLVQMCRLERLHCQQSPPFCLLTWKNADVHWSRDLFRLSRGAFWYNVALKVDGEGVTRTNSDNVRATMLQQQNVALKIVRRAMLLDVDF